MKRKRISRCAGTAAWCPWGSQLHSRITSMSIRSSQHTPSHVFKVSVCGPHAEWNSCARDVRSQDAAPTAGQGPQYCHVQRPYSPGCPQGHVRLQDLSSREHAVYTQIEDTHFDSISMETQTETAIVEVCVQTTSSIRAWFWTRSPTPPTTKALLNLTPTNTSFIFGPTSYCP